MNKNRRNKYTNIMKRIIVLILILTISITLQAKDNLPLHLKIMSTDRLEEPQIWNGYIFLTASTENNPRFVGVAFDYESYSIIHPFVENEKSILIHTSRIPEKEVINYRLIIDGLWIADPLGKNNTRDNNGIYISKLYPGIAETIKVIGPILKDTGHANFTLRSQPDSTVSLVGTFNGWDPYMSSMNEITSGVYSIDLRLKKGAHYYYFIVDGKKTMDPMNFSRAINREGEEVSRIIVP